MTDAADDPDPTREPQQTDIRELDPQTVERIAAGEVVERPASVVKELIENAIDADADRVDVTVEDGGTELIRVADDGVGMTEPQVRTAVEQHTTSKIRDIEDLESGVATLGFRGEALHAIGAVSRITIDTRPRAVEAGDGRGTELVVEGGEITAVSPAGCPEGTTVEIRDLFYNVPARRKYLKQPSTEFAHVNTVVTGYALANPGVAVSLTHGERETFATTGQGDLRESVMSVYGREVAQSMIPVEPNELPEGPLESISGLVSHPETNRASRDYLNTYVNGRYVTANSVREAVVEAYDAQLAPDRYPFAVLVCEVDPATVDVNVHPRKLEVRFADEEGLRQQVEAAVSAALMREGLLRTGAPRGKSAPEQTEIRPDDGREGDREEPSTGAGGETASRESEIESGSASGAGRRETADGVTHEGGNGVDGPDVSPHRGSREQPEGDGARGETPGTEGSAGSADAAPADAGGEETARRAAGRKFRGGKTQTSLGDVDAPDDEGVRSTGGVGDGDRPDLESLPAMRILGQFKETYVVAETADGLVLVDQHAADERINYERLRERFQESVTTQVLAEPVEVSLTAGEAAMASERSDALAQLGFETERVDDRRVRVRTVPTLVAEAADPTLLRDVLAELVTGDNAAADTVEAAADRLLADLACYPSITGNTSLTEGSVRELLVALDDCENPYACPHGRPVLIEVDVGEVEARFERDYPGHGG